MWRPALASILGGRPALSGHVRVKQLVSAMIAAVLLLRQDTGRPAAHRQGRNNISGLFRLWNPESDGDGGRLRVQRSLYQLELMFVFREGGG